MPLRWQQLQRRGSNVYGKYDNKPNESISLTILAQFHLIAVQSYVNCLQMLGLTSDVEKVWESMRNCAWTWKSDLKAERACESVLKCAKLC